MPVVVIAPRDAVFEKIVSNMQEVARARRPDRADWREARRRGGCGRHRAFPANARMSANFAPIAYAAPIQMLAYHTAVIMGKDADQPRNLAKSVTVE